MTFNTVGIEELQTRGIRGDDASEYPKYFIFAGSENTYTGSETELYGEYERKLVAWSKTGIHSKYLVELTSLEAVGSNVGATGLVGSEANGVLFTSNESFIGDKTNAFNVQVEGEIIIRRPTV